MTQNPDDNFRPDMDMDETLRPFDVQEQSNRRAMVLLFVAFAILVIIALILFNTYSSGTRDRDAPPVIAADKTPFKIKPENPGGEETPNQDKAIYDVMNGGADGTTEPVNTVNAAEDPMPMPATEDTGAIADAPQPVETEVTPPPASAAMTEPSQPVASASSSVVQVASVRTQSAAQALWTQLRADFPDIAPSGLSSDIKRVDLGDRGVFYRLRVAGFADKAAASRMCDQFKAKGQACFVTSR